jgi:hypothetical protein
MNSSSLLPANTAALPNDRVLSSYSFIAVKSFRSATKELKREKAIELLRVYKITYRNAAKMIGVTIYEPLDIMEKKWIKIGDSLAPQ